MNERVLIIEDEENISRMMRLTLEAAQYAVANVADGPQGIAAYGDGRSYDLVLLDQRMPGMDGLSVLRELKQRNPAARVIMITAYASIELAVEAMKLGATDFVRKPLTPEILRGAVAAALTKQTGAAPVEQAAGSRPADIAVIPTITLNGFEILREAEIGPQSSNEFRFVVKSPTGEVQEVIIEISNDLIVYVERVTRRELPGDSSFWLSRAERALGEYLWNEGKIPPDNHLTLNEIPQSDLTLAAAWTGR